MPLKKLLYLRTNEHAQLIFIYVICILSDVACIDKPSTIIHMCKWICAYVYVYARLCAYMYVYAHACSLCLYVYTHICKYMHMHRIYLHLIHIKIRYIKIKLRSPSRTHKVSITYLISQDSPAASPNPPRPSSSHPSHNDKPPLRILIWLLCVLKM